MTTEDPAPSMLTKEVVSAAISRITDREIEVAVDSLVGDHDGLKRAQAVAERFLELSVLDSRFTEARSRVRSAGHGLPSQLVLLDLAREPYLSCARVLAKGSSRNTRQSFGDDVTQLASQLDGLPRRLPLDESSVKRWIVDDLLGWEVAALREASRGRGLTSSVGAQPRSDASVYGAYLASLWWRQLVIAAVVARHLQGASEAGTSASQQRPDGDQSPGALAIGELVLDSRDFDQAQRGEWSGLVEPFLAYVHALAQSGDLGDADQYRLDFNLKQLYGELDHPDGASGSVVRKYMARILAIIHSRLDDADLAQQMGRQGAALTRAIGEAEKLTREAGEDEEREVATRVVEELATALDLEDREGAFREVAKQVGWIGMHAVGTAAGASVVAKLIHDVDALQAYPFGWTTGWGALVGGILGLLGTFSARWNK